MAIVVATLAIPAAASAYFAPSLGSVAVSADRHPTATFSAPGAEDATIYLATNPNRATDGRFFDEHTKYTDTLTLAEIQGGRWFYEGQIDPGTYYVMLRAYCWRYEDTNCADGFSSVVPLTVPLPTIRYITRIGSLFRGISVYPAIRASVLGTDKQYRVCYISTARRQRCVGGTINGYSWNESASDEIRIAVTRAMPTVTTFTWFVEGRVVGRRTVRVR